MLKDLVLPEANVPIIDESRLLAEFGGDREILVELRDLFLDQAPPLYEVILKALETGDLAVVAADAHSLKGACATYGAPRMYHICREIELAAKADDLDTVQAYHDHFVAEFTVLKQGIEAIGAG